MILAERRAVGVVKMGNGDEPFGHAVGETRPQFALFSRDVESIQIVE